MKPLEYLNNCKSAFLGLAGCVLATPLAAFEIITKEDIEQGVVIEEQLERVADNAIFLIDTSSSMNDEYHDTGKSKLEVAIETFSERNTYFPELGHRFGIYEYTPWKVVYDLQLYDREKVAAALDALPEKGSGPTPLASGIERAIDVVDGLTGKTVVFLFYDGDYTGPNADPAIWRLVHDYDVCLLMISSVDNEKESEQLSRNVAALNTCSRVIPLDYYVERPEYLAGALFDLRATEKVVTVSKSRVAGVAVENIVFDFDKTELSPEDRAELDRLGVYMAENDETYAVLAGYTDNTGVEEYNQHLSRMRTEMVAAYLAEEHGIDLSRIVLHWYGSSNPVASNDTAEGRAKNRRVEVVIGGV